MYVDNKESVREILLMETSETSLLMKMNDILLTLHLDMESENNMYKLASMHYACGDVLEVSADMIKEFNIEKK